MRYPSPAQNRTTYKQSMVLASSPWRRGVRPCRRLKEALWSGLFKKLKIPATTKVTGKPKGLPVHSSYGGFWEIKVPLVLLSCGGKIKFWRQRAPKTSSLPIHRAILLYMQDKLEEKKTTNIFLLSFTWTHPETVTVMSHFLFFLSKHNVKSTLNI